MEPVPFLTSFEAVKSSLASLTSLQVRGSMTLTRTTIGTSVGRKLKTILLDNWHGNSLLSNLAALAGWLLGVGGSLVRRDRLQAGRLSFRLFSIAICARIAGFVGFQLNTDEVVGLSVNILVTGLTHLLALGFKATDMAVVGLQTGQEPRRKGAAKLHGAKRD